MVRKPDIDAVLIAGPTASGKSALALHVAEAFGGTVINADSMQVYRELRVLTARPTAEDEVRAPHRLYGHVPASEVYSVARWLADVTSAIDEAKAQGRLPVITGGTGLYFKALLEGLSPVPDVPGDVRRFWRAEAERLGAAALHGLLEARDPAMAARLRPTDPQRIVRALEVIEASGRSLAQWQAEQGHPVLDASRCIRLCLTLPRDILYGRCDCRFAAMLALGGIEEVAALDKLNLDASLPVMRAIGVKPLMRFLAGAFSLADATSAGQGETRRYAKRQVTWAKRHMIAWKHIDAQQMERTKHEIYTHLASSLDPALS